MSHRGAFGILCSVSVTFGLLGAACGDDDGPPAVSFGDMGRRDLGPAPEAGPDAPTPPPPPTDGGGTGDGGIDTSGRCASEDECAFGRRMRACCPDCLMPLTRAEIDGDPCVMAEDEEYTEANLTACRPDRRACVGDCACPEWVGVTCDVGVCSAYVSGNCRTDGDCGVGQQCIDRNGDGRTECVATTDYCVLPEDCAMGEECRDHDLDGVPTCGPPVECIGDMDCDSGTTGPCIGNICTGRVSDDGGVPADAEIPRYVPCTTVAQCAAAGLPADFVCADFTGDGNSECIPDPANCGGCGRNEICTEFAPGMYACLVAM
ncbi:MAG: hypothetical protein IT379_28180 [Deltaproteobacteria bacterium]|nr:hypothetical protein [Deltaproteobacteria bacterium]